ncbi:glucose 1-dehydrogenase [Cryobacterium sp. TMS1-20-1]|uniref:glucose 1-dehydrogenase n=1 Tax=Cryobacterium sp. TMS1-20-1 TaxID=1259223 RepID=UPI00106AB6A0|nr:glucose 1-dehydrogenase [Cryobacterium sp. TMS1-20-1]TFC80555.1 glucose 1-dehydrogenase [Cryobacterium sp. TMS1-20-1]
MNRMTGRVALITGAARGMGASHARLLVDEGAQVVVADVLDADGEALAAELGDDAIYVHLDVTDEANWAEAVRAALDHFGRLDVLVNNAGVNHVASVAEHTLEHWNRVIAINLTGAFLGIRAASDALIASGSGSIVNISSIGGLQGFAMQAAYISSKFGVRGLTKTVALELGAHNVRCNSVHPGFIHTPMTEGADDTQAHVAMKRAGDPIEVSRAVLFLAGADSSFSTGAEFVVDGGETAGLAQNAVFH